MASYRLPNGKHRILVADPPVCSHAAQLAALEAEGAKPNVTTMPLQLEDGAGLLKNDDPLVTDCKKLFVRTVQENCNKKNSVSVTSATVMIIDGISVHMIAQVCNPSTRKCHPHRPECDFEVS